jgi:DNA mismatch repair protein MutL
MPDVIQLLPEHVANQIAAGEVVQRPASVVKELLENAIDAGASRIQLIVREAGKTLVQVIDNGCGMSETDARMSFERHATSKIRDAKDLFAIRTMGFRGEALASIAAVAQVEMRTRQAKNELGIRLVVEHSTIQAQEPCQCEPGTSIAVKNLFFNVPARKSFLKSDSVEMKHVFEEFQRAAIANPDIAFSLHHNEQEIYRLAPGNLRQRVVKIFGEAINHKIVPVQQDTDILRISGFVGKPEAAKRVRGEQMFFVNQRFIKSSYLHHAVATAYDDLLASDQYPLYVIMLDIDPLRIDINVHPTKQEIKFDDEKLVYNYLKVSVRHALGSHNVTPTLDFDQETAFQPTFARTPTLERPTPAKSASVDNYQMPRQDARDERNLRNWQRMYEGLGATGPVEQSSASASLPWTETNIDMPSGEAPPELDDQQQIFSKNQKEPYQLHGQYIVSQIRSGFVLIDQQAASERILYERYLAALQHQPIATQQALFPKTVEFSPADAALLRDMLPEINQLGFDVAAFGGHAFVVQGVPADFNSQRQNEEAVLQRLLARYKENLSLDLGTQENVARSMARSAAIKRGQLLAPREMQDLIDQLFACTQPAHSPSGRNCFITIELEELAKRFA